MNPTLARGLYDLVLTSLWPVIGTYYRVRIRTDGKYRSSYRQRLGLVLPPAVPGPETIWVHALSLGETLSVVPLLKALRANFPHHEIVLSSATESGRDIARKRAAPYTSRQFILPHDFRWSMNQVVSRIRPSLFILTETDLWPNLMLALECHGIPTVLVNGRISERSFRRLRWFRKITELLWNSFSLIFTQSKRDQVYFQQLGAAPEKIFAAGNLKFDLVRSRSCTPSPESLRSALQIRQNQPIWLAGSTHPGEEEPILAAHRQLRGRFPGLLLILAPRHPDRRHEIASICRRHQFRVGFRNRAETTVAKDVYLLDTIGELSSCYPLAQAAFIGGSLVPFGGHNPLEAAIHGIPTCWGPHLSNFREIEESLLQYGCSQTVHSSSDLVDRIGGWLADSNLRVEVSHNCSRLFATHQDVAQRIVNRIRQSILIMPTRP